MVNNTLPKVAMFVIRIRHRKVLNSFFCTSYNMRVQGRDDESVTIRYYGRFLNFLTLVFNKTTWNTGYMKLFLGRQHACGYPEIN